MPNPPAIHYVVFHKPGPAWQYEVDFRGQEGVGQHVQHYLKLHQEGKLELGGPFLVPDTSGMMVATKEVSQEELEAFAASDPAVQIGLLIYEIRPWLTAMEH
jgi:uncharacterized protein YciI